MTLKIRLLLPYITSLVFVRNNGSLFYRKGITIELVEGSEEQI